MSHRRLRTGAVSMTVSVIIAGTFVLCAGWASGSRNPSGGAAGGVPIDERGPGSVGVAGPLGPQAFSAVPAYFRAETFTAGELGQYQDVSSRLPAGRYLLDLKVTATASSGEPDCLGVSFPLAKARFPSSSQVRHQEFTGYVTVARSDDSAVVTCYQRGTAPDSSVSYALYFRPVS